MPAYRTMVEPAAPEPVPCTPLLRHTAEEGGASATLYQASAEEETLSDKESVGNLILFPSSVQIC